jgi:hypothetical protein
MADDQILYETPWLHVVVRDGWYTFVHTRNSVIYLLPYRQGAHGTELLARFEICPAHSAQHEQTSITGQCKPGVDPQEVALEELYEEGGYQAQAAQLVPLGARQLVKFADTVAHLFAIDLTGMPRSTAPGDGSRGEVGAYCEWISMEQASASVCPVFLAMIALAGLSPRGWQR